MRTIAQCDCCEKIVDSTTDRSRLTEVDGLLTIRILGEQYHVCEACNKKPVAELLTLPGTLMLRERRKLTGGG